MARHVLPAVFTALGMILGQFPDKPGLRGARTRSQTLISQLGPSRSVSARGIGHWHPRRLQLASHPTGPVATAARVQKKSNELAGKSLRKERHSEAAVRFSLRLLHTSSPFAAGIIAAAGLIHAFADLLLSAVLVKHV